MANGGERVRHVNSGHEATSKAESTTESNPKDSEANLLPFVLGAGIAAGTVKLRNMRQEWLNGNIPFWIDHANPAVDGDFKGEGCTSSWGGHGATTYAGDDKIRIQRKTKQQAEAIDAKLPEMKIVGDFSKPGQVTSTRTLPDGSSEERITQLALKPAPFLKSKSLGSEQLTGWTTTLYRNGKLQETRVASFTKEQTEVSGGQITEKVFKPGHNEPSRVLEINFRTNGIPGSRDKFCAHEISREPD